MTITVIGAGYVGLVTAAVFSHLGNKVYCVDVIKERIEDLKKGKVHFFEPQLPELILENVQAKRLFFTTSYAEAVPKSQVIFICVGTPPKENGEADLSYLFAAVEESAKNMTGYTLLTIKSTVPIGYEDDLEAIVKKYAKSPYEFAASPEFLREGTAIEDTMHPDRIVIGSNSKKAQKVLLDLHSPLSGERVICDMRSAQLIKYASNSFLATKISYVNALAILCENMGADVSKVLAGVGADKRIGHSFMHPGVGYGGSCLPKDINAFIAQASSFNYDFQLLRAVDSINTSQIDRFINKIRFSLNAQEGKKTNLEGFRLAILGLAFKPNTDDIRDAPSVKIIKHLLELKASIVAYDPQTNKNMKKAIPQIDYAADAYKALEGADAMILITEWPEFAQMNFDKIKSLMKKPIIVDGRNMFDREKLKNFGFSYYGVGR